MCPCLFYLMFIFLCAAVVFGHKLQLKNPNHKKRPTSETDESIIYVKPEDEIFHKVFWSTLLY